MKTPTYFAVQRDGRRTLAVAAIEYPEGAITCAARAQRDLQAFGVTGRIVPESAAQQKNFCQALGMMTYRGELC